MAVLNILYTDAEWAARKELLAKAADSLEERVFAYNSEHTRLARVSKRPSRMLSITVNIAPQGLPSATSWELFYRYVVTETRAVAYGVNSNPENRLGDRAMRCSVSPDNPVSGSRQNELMRDFWSHRLGQTTALNPIYASFRFPYTPSRTGAQG